MLQDDGAIVEIGTYRDLSRRHPNVAVIGSGNEVMLPGFVNGHHHIGLTPAQLGSPDMPLELSFVTRMVMRNVDLYLDTLYSAFEMIASGVTAVQHLRGRARKTRSGGSGPHGTCNGRRSPRARRRTRRSDRRARDNRCVCGCWFSLQRSGLFGRRTSRFGKPSAVKGSLDTRLP